jgi:hypothetical protein
MIPNEEQQMIRDTARAFARERLAPFAAEWDRTARFPRAALAELGELGFLGMLVSEAWGGVGASHVAYALAMEELAAGDASCSTVISVQALVNGILEAHGSEAQKGAWLRRLARGEALAAFALTEPHCGSDAANLRTRALADGGGWRIDGTKQFISTGANAEVVLVFAKTDPARGASGISAFLVPTDTPGFSVAKIEKKLGQRASDTTQLVFDDMRVGDDALVGELHRGYRMALATLEGGRIGIAAQAVGMGRSALDHAIAYAQQREAFGTPIYAHQAVAHRLADMATQVEAARQLVLHAAALRDAGQRCAKEASMAKLFASEMAERVASDALQTLGGYGYLNDFPLERIFRDARLSRIYEGTSDIQRMLISRALVDG